MSVSGTRVFVHTGLVASTVKLVRFTFITHSDVIISVELIIVMNSQL